MRQNPQLSRAAIQRIVHDAKNTERLMLDPKLPFMFPNNALPGYSISCTVEITDVVNAYGLYPCKMAYLSPETQPPSWFYGSESVLAFPMNDGGALTTGQRHDAMVMGYFPDTAGDVAGYMLVRVGESGSALTTSYENGISVGMIPRAVGDNTWQDIGIYILLPEAGTYTIISKVGGLISLVGSLVPDQGFLYTRIYDVTNAAEVNPNRTFIVLGFAENQYSLVAGSSPVSYYPATSLRTAGATTVYTVNGATTLRLEGMYQTANGPGTESNAQITLRSLEAIKSCCSVNTVVSPPPPYPPLPVKMGTIQASGNTNVSGVFNSIPVYAGQTLVVSVGVFCNVGDTCSITGVTFNGIPLTAGPTTSLPADLSGYVGASQIFYRAATNTDVSATIEVDGTGSFLFGMTNLLAAARTVTIGGTVDKSGFAFGASSTPDTGTVSTTAAPETIHAAFLVYIPTGDPVIFGGGYTEVQSISYSFTGQIVLMEGFQPSLSTNTYGATLSSAGTFQQWCGEIVTLK